MCSLETSLLLTCFRLLQTCQELFAVQRRVCLFEVI